MSVVDNMLYELGKQSNLILERIKETSYGTPTPELWELLGSIQSLTETNLYILEELKKEISAESVGLESGSDDAVTMSLNVKDVQLPP